MRAYPHILAASVLIGLLLLPCGVFAWSSPSGTPTTNNVLAPINVGTTSQAKNGGFSINSLVVFGSALLSGLGSGIGQYLNFDYTTSSTSGVGAAGYGLRDNNGTMEFKNLGDVWQAFVTNIPDCPVGQVLTKHAGIFSCASRVVSGSQTYTVPGTYTPNCPVSLLRGAWHNG